METKEKISNIALATGMSIFFICLNSAILNSVYNYGMELGIKGIPIKTIISGLLIAPIFEEFIFRWIPLRLLRDSDILEGDRKWFVIAILGIIFGWVHGGYFNIYIQGVAGFFFGWVYIKNNNSYWSAVVTHFLYNFMIYIVFPLIVK